MPRPTRLAATLTALVLPALAMTPAGAAAPDAGNAPAVPADLDEVLGELGVYRPQEGCSTVCILSACSASCGADQTCSATCVLGLIAQCTCSGKDAAKQAVK